MKKTFLTVAGLATLLSPAYATLLLNEVHINLPDPQATGSDANYEFIELRSTTNGVEAGTGLTVLIIDNNGGQVGEVKEAWSLNELSTGTNGLLMIGNGYDDAPLGGPWASFRDALTTTGDPAGAAPLSSMGDDDIGPNGGLTVLLVTGWNGMTNQTDLSLGDVDLDNNSVADWLQAVKPAGAQLTQPWTTVVDSVGFRDLANNPDRLPYCPPSADLSIRAFSGTVAPTFPPDSIARRLSRATAAHANQSSAWYGGNIAGTARDGVAYDVQYFGDFKGQATPGQTNLDAAPIPGNFLINEVEINPPGAPDGNFEYIEILNTVVNNGSQASSLQGLSLLVIGSNTGSNLGKIVEAWDLGGMSTGSNGLLLLGNDYSNGRAPWGKIIDPLTQLGDPSAAAGQTKFSDMGDEDIGSNNGFTLLLVRGYAGTIGQTVGNAAGVLTIQPWTAIVDSIGFDEVDVNGALVGGKSYASGKVDPTYLDGGVTKHYNPDVLSRKPGSNTANVPGAWYGGELAARSPYGIGLRNGFFIGGFRGESTPGRANLSATPPSGAVRLNEVHVNPPPAVDGTEFIEIINPDRGIVGMSDLWLLVVGAKAPELGVIRRVLDLRGMSTGPNGLAIFGDGIEEEGNPWNSVIPAQTLRDDPESYNDDGTINGDFGNFRPDFIEPNSGVAILLVRGFTGALNQDLDADDNSTFNVTPWAQLVDSISFGTAVDPAVPFLNFPSYDPGNLSRSNDNVAANTAAAWFGGELQGPVTALTSTDYTANWIGSFKGAASPGRFNHSMTPSASASVLLNEININPPGGDNDKEFIELTSSNRQSISTNNYTILLLDSEGADTGRVLEAWSLDGLSTGTNGLLLTGSGYTSTASLPWIGSNAIAAATHIGSPAEMDFDDIGGATDNGATSILLVKNFTGRVGDDLDTLPVVNDGVLDSEPWGALVDAVGVKYWDALAVPAPGALVGKVYGGVDLSQSQPGYTPDNLSRYLDSLTPLAATSWYGGDIAGTAGTSVAYDDLQRFPSGEFIGAVTPGQPNLTPNEIIDDTADPDNDGVVNLIEVALGMNMNVSDAQKLPTTGTKVVGGTTYPVIIFTRPPNGTATPPNKYTVNGLLYTVQFSTDLATWTDGAQLASAEDSGSDPPLDIATYRPSSAAFAQGLAAGQMFLRLKVDRQ